MEKLPQALGLKSLCRKDEDKSFELGALTSREYILNDDFSSGEAS